EAPPGITNFADPVRAGRTLPASFYSAARPTVWWGTPWGTPAWPAIGPDVSGGNVSNSPTGGHANKIPARLCFENTAVDPAYPSSSPRILLFNASTCYIGSSGGPPAAPLFLRFSDLSGLGSSGPFFSSPLQ